MKQLTQRLRDGTMEILDVPVPVLGKVLWWRSNMKSE
jgi:hypothetical protein